ncbi:hypothetical protein G7046_g3167 [Stylonectria norvegica]|nr:hypothetical protein G7046_g3167 [Stylonectria norvegica]
MSDARRPRRPDSRQMWDDSDRRDRRSGPRDDRRGYRSRSRERRGQRDHRSRSPERRYRDHDAGRGRQGDRGGGRDRGRDGSRNHDERERRDRRQGGEEEEPVRPRRDNDDRDRRGALPLSKPFVSSLTAKDKPRRSASPPSEALPTRSKPASHAKKPSPMAINVPGSPASDEGEVRDDDDENNNDGDSGGEMEVIDDDMAAMQAMMGFGSFGSTKGKKIVGNNVGAVQKEKTTEYRQYMNRQGGFNRPLSPGR